MRSSKSRSRNKQNRQRSLGNIVSRVFDSSGPEGKVRGTPQQIIEKYLALARDAQLSNDRVAEQSFFQHAEHYTRMLSEAQRELAREQEMRQAQGGPANGNGNGNGHGQGQDRGDGRERYEHRPPRAEDAEQPDFAPLGQVEGDDDGPGLVETPEMYHAPEPAAFEGHVPDFLGGGAPQAREDRPRRDRRDRGGDTRTEPGPERTAESTSDRAPSDDGQPQAGRVERGDRVPRGPRRPRAPRAEGEAGAPKAPSAKPSADGDE